LSRGNRLITVRLSTAADITLGFSYGRFERGARLYCINLLLFFQDGCKANCLYCGQARDVARAAMCRTLIRVDWPLRKLDEVLDAYEAFVGNGTFARPYRFCVATITHPRAAKAEVEVIRRI